MSDHYPDIEKTVQDYVLGKLSDKDSDEFEAYFLGQPDIVEMLATAQRMHVGMSSIELNNSELKRQYVRSYGGLFKIKKFISMPIPAYAVAAIVATVIAGQLGFNRADQSVPFDFELARFSTEAKRGVAKKITLNFSEFDKSIGLFIKLKEVSYPNYKVRLVSSESGDRSWESELFQVSSLRDKLVLIPSHVATGSQIISVFGVANDGTETPEVFCNYSEVCR